MAIDEGYIKFNMQWEKSAPLKTSRLSKLIKYRDQCFQAGFIGVYEDSGIGYGNISVRYENTGQFIISGTQTGHLETTTTDHFTLVTAVDFDQNTVYCKGPVKASAESLTHAVFYQLDENIQAVVHIHHAGMWKRLMHQVPTTGEKVAYGTVEMVEAIQALYKETDLPRQKILVMAGHEEGLVGFGENLEEAYRVLNYLSN